MSCVGKELVEDASRVPIVDVVDDQDIVTNAVVLQVSFLYIRERNTSIGVYNSCFLFLLFV